MTPPTCNACGGSLLPADGGIVPLLRCSTPGCPREIPARAFCGEPGTGYAFTGEAGEVPEPLRVHALLRYDRAERASGEAEAASHAAQKAAREAYDEMSEAYDALTKAEEDALDEADAVLRFEGTGGAA